LAGRASERVRFLRSLRAVREYTSEEISDAALGDVLEVARWSGSASNRQPVELVVVRDHEVTRLIGDNGARAVTNAAIALLTVASGEAERAELDAFDTGRLVERIMLAAKAHGIGANVSTIKGEGPALVKKALGIPADRKVWTVVSLGHIDHAARAARPANPNAGRKPAQSFVHWDRY
jgi:nitroreductase